LGSVEYKSEASNQAATLPPAARLASQQQDEAAAGGGDNALLASKDVQPAAVASSSQQQQQQVQPTAATKETSTGAGAASSNSSSSTGAGAHVDPLHDNLSDAEKEAEQLAALSRVIQQQQDTITKQVRAGTRHTVGRYTQGMLHAYADDLLGRLHD
jgi:hypothetical protein